MNCYIYFTVGRQYIFCQLFNNTLYTLLVRLFSLLLFKNGARVDILCPSLTLMAPALAVEVKNPVVNVLLVEHYLKNSGHITGKDLSQVYDTIYS